MKFSSPEVLCISSCALFITGNPVVASIFLGLGVVGAIFRVGMEMQEKQAQDKAVEEAKLETNEAQELAAEKMSEAKESQAKAQELNQKANQAEKLAQEAQLAAEQKEAESSFAQERAELSPPQLANANKLGDTKR